MPGTWWVSKVERFATAAAKLGIAVARGEPLARHTTFRIGGPADLWATVNDPNQLRALADLAAENSIPAAIVGGGSNVLVSDAGVRGLLIANRTRGFGMEMGERGTAGRLVAESGVALAGLARWTIREGWAGLEWAVSVPGTVGGAVIGNAGAHGGCIADNLAWASVAYPGQAPRRLARVEFDFTYRSSALKQQPCAALACANHLAGGRMDAANPGPVVLAAAFELQPGDAAELAGRAERYLARRRETQPVEPSAGSIFRNPAGDYAGRLIEAVGLKGHRCGGAQVSPRHANFIIKTGDASAADVLALMTLIQRRVCEQYGITLTPEIVLLGDWSGHE